MTVILFLYYRTVVFGGGSIGAPGVAALIHYGANFPPAVWGGDWWRLSTSVLLHGSAMHILFNLLALKQIGPGIEELFGKGRMLFFFMVTGILASFGSAWLRDGGVGIGASGAIMGLVGLAAGWGHREGGSNGQRIRDSMLQWGMYTLVFGFMVGADNTAHFVGIASGFALGFVVRPARDRGLSVFTTLAQSLLGLLLFCGTVLAANFPPKSVLDFTAATVSGATVVACGEYEQGTQQASPSVAKDSKGQRDELEPYELEPLFIGDCKRIAAKLGTMFGIQVRLEGDPADGMAELTVKVLHPPITNPHTKATVSTDEWTVHLALSEPQYTGWQFGYPWELVPGEWTMQIIDPNGKRILAERTVTITTAPSTTE